MSLSAERTEEIRSQIADHLAELSEGITMRDVEQIKATIPIVRYVSPEARVGFEKLVWEGREVNTMINGVTPDWLPVAKRWVDPSQGRFISDLDILHKTDVCVLGSSIANDLFPANVDPIGKVIRESFTEGGQVLLLGAMAVVGVLVPPASLAETVKFWPSI